ncbi:hypothetical protein [Streptomyces sp. NPDC004728]|uniref:hypothetical protein n=1 Tax=Streptomyces sp. NPDC004728 TaxID=3154289 RepID=UPI0033B028FF
MTAAKDPDYVSFTDAAQLLVRHGFVGSMTPQGLRYIARSRENRDEGRWPFGDKPGQEPYLTAGNTRLMRTALLLEYFEKHPPTGRGPDRSSRARRSRPS